MPQPLAPARLGGDPGPGSRIPRPGALTDETEWARLRANAVERAGGYDWGEVARRIEATCARLVRPAAGAAPRRN